MGQKDIVDQLGWHLHPDSWGQGFATEAARGAIAHGFHSGLREIYAVVRPDNERSLAVCRRLGLEPLGLTSRWYDAELEAWCCTADNVVVAPLGGLAEARRAAR